MAHQPSEYCDCTECSLRRALEREMAEKESIKKLRGEGCIICQRAFRFREEEDVGVCAVCVLIVKERDKLTEWIDKEMNEIDKDERFHYPPAQVQVNAPLALIQVSMKARHTALKQVKDQLLKATRR